MKTIKLLAITLFITVFASQTGAQTNEISSELIAALDNGDANTINAALSQNVELVIGNKNDVFSKQQASGIISDFFKTNKVNSFQLLHKGNKDAASFAIGLLKTSNGTFRVYILTRKQGSTSLIQQLRIEFTND